VIYKSVCWALFFYAILVTPAIAHDRLPQGGETSAAPVGIEERLGAKVPLDLTFRDASGKVVRFGDLTKTPVILSLVYFRCRDVCPRILESLAQLLGRVSLVPGKDFSVVTVSFDLRDTPATAAAKKKNYLKAIGRPYPPESWRFLTGDSETIHRLTEAVGFHFQRSGDGFQHPAALVVLSPEGKVIRYFYGLTYLPFDLKMSVNEALAGRPGPTIRRALLYCFRYDPEGRTYVFNLLKVSGTVTLFFGAVILIFLLRPGKKDQR